MALLNKFHKYIKVYYQGYFNILLTALILLFIFRPYEHGAFYNGFWQLCLIAVLLSAIFNCHHPKIIKNIALCIGIPSIFAHWLDLIFPLKWIILIHLSLLIIFLIIITGSILVHVVLKAKVTLETLRGAICVYFLLGFGFSIGYFFIELVKPGSIYISFQGTQQFSITHYLSEMIYFSFVTLLAIGYGDINAISDVGQTLVILEGIMGQFYLAIFVARLVSVYSIIQDKSLFQKIRKKPSEE